MQSAQALPVEKDKRTLCEIQDEERARQEENDFLKWWAEEEARTKQELDAAIAASTNANSNSNASDKKRRKPKKPKDLRDVGTGSGSSGPVPGPSTGSADTSPTTADRPQKPRRPPRQPQNGTRPREDSNVSVQAPARPEADSPRRGGGPRSRGSLRGSRGGQSTPAVQAM
jgi:hypothetical protein